MLTKLRGPLALPLNCPQSLIQKFVLAGHITLEDRGDQYSLADICGRPVALLQEDTSQVLLVSMFDGPDKNLPKVSRFVSRLVRGEAYKFVAIVGSSPDPQNPERRLRVYLHRDPSVSEAERVRIVSEDAFQRSLQSATVCNY
jgi:hypothetical protein